MADINTLMLCGRLGADPELRKTNTGKAVASFSLATSRSVRTPGGDWDEVAEWHKIVCWEAHAERAAKRLCKGDKIFVTGELRYNTWTDKAGQKRVSSEVVARRWDLVAKKLSAEEREDRGLTPAPVKAPASESAEDSVPY